MVRIFATIAVAASIFSAAARPPPNYLTRQEVAQQQGQFNGASHPQHNPNAPQSRRLQVETKEEDDQLRHDLLLNYDRGSFPWAFAWNNTNSSISDLREGLPIEVGINFHRVFSVDIINSVADLTVWFRQSWVDPRLAWDPAEYNGTTTTWFWVGDGIGAGETSEIWTPDTELWNMAESLKETLTDTYAVVSSNGGVFWSRPGHMKPACKFRGLDSFPFDALSCTMELGSWSYSGLYVRPIKMGGTGFSIGGSETAGEAFAEYQLAKGNPVVCREKIYPPFPTDPEEDWPVLLYDVTFYRSWEPYARGYIVTQVILNLAGFATFWLPVQSGERVGLAITAMLAAVASELVVAASLPSSSEITWFQTFSLFSLSFAALALFESVAVIFFFYYTGSDLKPSWWKWLRSRQERRHAEKESRKVLSEKQNGGQKKDEPSVEEEAADIGGAPENGIVVGVSADDASVHDCDQSWGESHVRFQESEAAPFTRDGSRPGRRLSHTLNARDADDFMDDLEAENNKKWKKVASYIDQTARAVIITAYIIILAIFLGKVERSP